MQQAICLPCKTTKCATCHLYLMHLATCQCMQLSTLPYIKSATCVTCTMYMCLVTKVALPIIILGFDHHLGKFYSQSWAWITIWAHINHRRLLLPPYWFLAHNLCFSFGLHQNTVFFLCAIRHCHSVNDHSLWLQGVKNWKAFFWFDGLRGRGRNSKMHSWSLKGRGKEENEVKMKNRREEKQPP